MLKLGIIQLSIQEGNIEKNCAHIEELVRKHSSDDIDLLCCPELCISGYNFEKAIISDREALFFSELASKYKIAIMAGINKKEGNQHYDVACIWDETGTLLGEYKKIHLWDKENDFFAKGEELIVNLCGFWILRIGKIFSIKKERRCDYVSERVESGLGLPVFRMQQYKSSRKPGLYGWIKQGIRGRGVLW